MSTKQVFYRLGLFDLLFLGTYLVYLLLPPHLYLAYYPIGIAQFLLFISCLVLLGGYTKQALLHGRSRKLTDFLLLSGFTLSLLGMMFSLLVWYAFMPR